MTMKVQWRWKLPVIYLLLVAGVGIVLTAIVVRGPAPDELWEVIGPWLSISGAPWAFLFSGFSSWWLVSAYLNRFPIDSDLSLGAIGLVILSGLQRHQITFPPAGGVDLFPAWAPDGSALAFVRSTPGTTQRLCILVAGDSVPNAITNFSVGSDWTPAWSPAGHELVFAHDTNYVFNLFIIASDGSRLRSLTTGSGLDFRPSW